MQCDSCGKTGTKKAGKNRIRRVETGGGSGFNLCNACLRKEISWRKIKNKQLKSHYPPGKCPKSKLFRTDYKFP